MPAAAEPAVEDELLERAALVDHRVVEAADPDVGDVAEPVGALKVLLCGGREGSPAIGMNGTNGGAAQKA